MIDERVATGRRKTAVASVRLRQGSGKIDINGRAFDEYFPLDIQRRLVLSPFEKIGGNAAHDIVIRVNGGGIEAQAVAIRLGITRTLCVGNEELQRHFKDLGYLTRDPRKKERKKYGQPGARKRFQFSKR
jgi:small subunit ribosomal protein S9